MTLPDENTQYAPAPPTTVNAGANDPTGLPWPRSWRGVYVFVMVCFATWVALLLALEMIFS